MTTLLGMLLNEQLRDWRQKNHLTREQAALRLGVSMATYIRWETGKASPRTLASIAAIKREVQP